LRKYCTYIPRLGQPLDYYHYNNLRVIIIFMAIPCVLIDSKGSIVLIYGHVHVRVDDIRVQILLIIVVYTVLKRRFRPDL